MGFSSVMNRNNRFKSRESISPFVVIIIINERMDLIGVVPEKEVVNKILESIHTQDYAY